MGSVSGESSSVDWDAHDCSAPEEKIFVSVRLRPLNDIELAKNEASDWECINSTTIIFKNTFQERSLSPTAYTFDRIFGSDCPTRQVYEEAAKKIALSVLGGMNSSIFAYGQTSSGKTYTMSGIMKYAIDDIYEYIDKHPEREFTLKFSAMEIYNEVVRDLLCSDGPPLRLLDDPVRGTVVERLTEVTIRDADHLKQQLAICEVERKVEDTALNEKSSRSHQIICLTVESEAREYLRAENSSTLTATVHFVDLAGSERTSQTSAAGTRLKEGCHINRSLLTLGTVIRKLSKGRNGHIPFRDSKLTRILQHSLGGNAKTAILCTMSPAHSHVEQSKSTLLFASCAKKVSTNAQVNVVMTEKALVKQLRKEIARLENELKNLNGLAASSNLTSAIKEKEQVIVKLDSEIKQLANQRDLAQSRLENALKSGRSRRSSKSLVDLNKYDKGSWTDPEYSTSDLSDLTDPLTSDISSRTSPVSSSRIEDEFLDNSEEHFLSNNTSPRLYIEKYFGPQSPDPSWFSLVDSNKLVGNCKEVDCTEIDFTKIKTIASTSACASSLQVGYHTSSGVSPCLSDEEISYPTDNLTKIKESPRAEAEIEIKNTSPKEVDNQGKPLNVEAEVNCESRHTKVCSYSSTASSLTNEDEEILRASGEDSEVEQKQEACVAQLNEMINSKLANRFQDDKGSDKDQNNAQSSSDWQAQFERQRTEIIELWHFCHIPLAYRTYFFLLFKGDPSENVYMEIELRRLSFLKKNLEGTSARKDDQLVTEASSLKALNRERESLSRKMLKKLSRKERKAIYEKWGINLKSKQRRLQVCRRIWTDTSNMEHIKESAEFVASLIGFKAPGNAPKELIGLSFGS